MANYLSPNGSPIIGTLEHLTGRAELDGIDPETGEPEYSGGTEIFYDDQRTAERDGKIIFLDEGGEEWTFDQLVLDEAEEAEDEAT